MSVEFWTSGASAGPRRFAQVAQAAETSGWDGISTVDSQNLATDPYVQLALAATATKRLKLMTSVTNVVTRHVAVTASSALTLQHLSDGRFVCGIGRGDSALAHIGRAPARLDWFEQYLETLAAYARGDEVSMDRLDMPSKIAPPVQGLGLADRPKTSSIKWASRVSKVPIEVAATGPKVIAAAARHADRVLFALGADPERVGWGIDSARQAATASGRDPDDLSFGVYVTVVCADDIEQARSLGRGSTSLFARFSAMHGKVTSPADEQQSKIFTAVHQAYDMNRHAQSHGDQTKVLTDEFLDTFAILGSAQRCIDKLGALRDLGVTKFIVTGADPSSKNPASVEAAGRIIADVAPAFR